MRTFLSFVKNNRLMSAIVFIGSLLLLIIVVPFEKHYCLFGQCGLWLVDKIRARDDFWQIALSQASFNSLPFQFPNASGIGLHGYHILYSLCLFVLSRLSLDPLLINGLFYPIIWVVAYTYLSLLLIKKVSGSKLVQTVFIFLQFFGGSFGYLFTLYHKQSFLFSEGMTYQPILYLTNKPLSLSILLFLAIVILLLSVKVWKKTNTILLAVLIFIVWGAKFHAGVAVCAFVGSYCICQYFQKKMSLYRLIALGAACAVSTISSVYIFYRPDLAGGTGSAPLAWAPFALAHGIIESPGMFYLRSLTNARYYLYSQGTIGPRLVAIELFSAFLYIFFLVGTRFISIISISSSMLSKKFTSVNVSMLITILFTGFMMLGFVQHADWFNTMQFFAFALIFLNIFTAESVSLLKTKDKSVNYVLVVIFTLFTIPFALATVYSTIGMMPQNGLVIKNDELEALAYLKKLPSGVVFTPVGGIGAINSDPSDRTLWKLTDTSYISATTQKKTYLSVQHQLSLMGISYEDRKKHSGNPENMNFLNMGIRYLYLPAEHPHSKSAIKSLSIHSTPNKKVFENSKYAIYVIN